MPAKAPTKSGRKDSNKEKKPVERKLSGKKDDAAEKKTEKKVEKKPAVKAVKKTDSKRRKARKSKTYKIDASIPANDGIFDAELLKGFEQYLLERIKVNGKTGKLTGKVSVKLNEAAVNVTTRIPFRKSYLKYLTKKYLKKKTLRDWLRIVATRKDTFELRYFNIHDQEEGGDEE